jgi:hypothetical protein
MLLVQGIGANKIAQLGDKGYALVSGQMLQLIHPAKHGRISYRIDVLANLAKNLN